ncbi:MAG TPA: metalloregulator ArsR/SmtB family transcription factor [Glycomyces sp.]|jgi:ArsR family transcriptional regulator|uniref:ArsR/SmtB family transcription factor n=1 Tax=Glycomyces tenuis TaxID=58116 RepID=UPI0004281B04|nr:metalloregulator ArsR/SmtB family transcription factor [Glycomyces tenuis]HEU5128768.1 metalloregulator ArsR/SmtB family transcription factor [Glycomyces sp.]HLU27887.1 metalloregulator ArsR/SmtB family transcription factor [Glycomyces sp.]
MVRVTVEAETPVSPVSGETISKADAERIAGVLKALADPNRLQLISLIQASPEQEACVAELTEPLGLSQPTVSHHLRILAEAGVVQRDKRGVWAYFRLVPETMRIVADLLTPPKRRRRR